MATKALLVRLEAKSGKEGAVEEFLVSALPLVEQEPGTKPWFAVRFGPSTFGIIDAFPDEAAREAHLGGPVGKALAEKADELFASPPDISSLDVLPTSSDAVAAEPGLCQREPPGGAEGHSLFSPGRGTPTRQQGKHFGASSACGARCVRRVWD